MPLDHPVAFGGRAPAAARHPERIDWIRPMLLTFLLLVAVQGAATLSLRPFVLAATVGNAALASVIPRWIWTTLVFAPLLALAKVAVFALVAWAIAGLAGREVSGLALLSTFLTGEIVVALTGVFAATVLWMRGISAIHGPADLRVAQGIDLFVDTSSSTIAMSVAESSTIFHLLWWLFLIIALPRATGLSRGWAVASATAVWALTLVLAVIRGNALA